MNEGRRELALLVAYTFQTLGRRRVSEDDWLRLLSFERKWFPPGKARLAANAARTFGLLRNAGERDFEIGLEAEGLTLPLDYRPNVEVLDALARGPATAGGAPGAPLPLFPRIVQAIARSLGQPEEQVVGRINATQEAVGGLLRAEVVALYYGSLQGVDLARFYDEVDKTLRP